MPSQKLRTYLLRLTRKRAPRGRMLPAALTVLAVIIAVCAASLYPTVRVMARSAAENNVTKAVNTAVNETIRAADPPISNIVLLDKSPEGYVTALTTDMAAANLITADVSSRVVALLSVALKDVNIPVGSLLGGALLSGRGFRVPVRVLSVGAVTAELENGFIEAGINQTLHTMTLAVHVTVDVLIFGDVTKLETTDRIRIAETVLVGGVPDTYTKFDDNGEIESTLEKYDIAN